MMIRPSEIRGTAIVALLFCLVSCGETSTDTSRPTTVATSAVLTEERTFVDASRPTRANGTAPASPVRTLATRIWYAPTALSAPACRGDRCALVVLAHGFGGRTARFDGIGRLLAAAGYIVAAPAFPLTNDQTPGGHLSGLSDLDQQPADVSFVIDEMLAASDDRADLLYRRIDTERIGALGHSLGGSTLLGATRIATCCADERIDATAYVAPAAFAVMPFFGMEPSADGPPVLIVNGSDDPLVKPEQSLALAHSFTAPWYYVEIPDVGHVFLIENIGEPQPFLYVTARAAVAFFDEYLGGATGATVTTIDELVAEGETADYSD